MGLDIQLVVGLAVLWVFSMYVVRSVCELRLLLLQEK